MGQKITVHNSSQGHAVMTYRISLPTDYSVIEQPAKDTSPREKTQITANELVTRCDNGTFDLNRPCGVSYHFGGHVTRRSDGNYDVDVYLD